MDNKLRSLFKERMERKNSKSGQKRVKNYLRRSSGIAFSCEDRLRHVLAHKGIPFVMLSSRRHSKTCLMTLLEQKDIRNVSKAAKDRVLDKPNVKKTSKRCDWELVRYEKIFQSWS